MDRDIVAYDTCYAKLSKTYDTIKMTYAALTAEQKTPAVDTTFNAIQSTLQAFAQNDSCIRVYINEHPVQAKQQAGLFDFLSKDTKETTDLDHYREQIDKYSGAIFVPYRFTVPLILFASFGLIAFFIALYLKLIDKKKGYGLEEPNIK